MVLLANNNGVYIGQDGQDDLWAALDARAAVVFIHPADLPGPEVPGVLPFAADFLLDTTRAAYLLVRNGIRRKYPNISFILSHAGGFVPYASHRMAVAIQLLSRHRSVNEPGGAADAAGLRQTWPHHLRLRLAFRPSGCLETLRRRPRGLPNGRNHQSSNRTQHRAAPLPTVGVSAGITGTRCGGCISSCGEPHGNARSREIDCLAMRHPTERGAPLPRVCGRQSCGRVECHRHRCS